jgi:hypothetical protein
MIDRPENGWCIYPENVRVEGHNNVVGKPHTRNPMTKKVVVVVVVVKFHWVAVALGRHGMS